MRNKHNRVTPEQVAVDGLYGCYLLFRDLPDRGMSFDSAVTDTDQDQQLVQLAIGHALKVAHDSNIVVPFRFRSNGLIYLPDAETMMNIPVSGQAQSVSTRISEGYLSERQFDFDGEWLKVSAGIQQRELADA